MGSVEMEGRVVGEDGWVEGDRVGREGLEVG